MESITPATEELIQLALREDIGAGDITTNVLIPEAKEGRAVIIAREELVVCGQKVAARVFELVDKRLTYTPLLADGTRVQADHKIAELSGPLRAILSGERTVLNFIQRLSGIATATAEVVARMAPYKIGVLDTRKTTPGWRDLEKYAVRTGGGTNHRQGLFDAVLIKNNHIDARGGDVSQVVREAREKNAAGTFIQVEVRDEKELSAALASQPDGILFDNMSPELLHKCVQMTRQLQKAPIRCEASGGINRDNVSLYAKTGVDFVSIGALTHSARAVDLSLRYLAPIPH